MALQDEAEADALRPSDRGSWDELRGDGDAVEEQGEEYGENLGEYEQEAEPDLQQVWVLCGGSGSDADASLASGLHVYHELQKQADVLVRSLSPSWSSFSSFSNALHVHLVHQIQP